MVRPLKDQPSVTTPEAIRNLLPKSMVRAHKEAFYVLALGSGNRVIGIQCVARGFSDSCPVDPREIFRYALIKRASAIVVAHNHPSGDPTPSALDISLTAQICAGAKLLNIRCLDHVIVARGGAFLSMLSAGLMKGEA